MIWDLRHFSATEHRLLNMRKGTKFGMRCWGISSASLLKPLQFFYYPITSTYTRQSTRNHFPEIRMDQQLDVSKLSEADKKELNQILTNEAQKSNIQQSK